MNPGSSKTIFGSGMKNWGKSYSSELIGKLWTYIKTKHSQLGFELKRGAHESRTNPTNQKSNGEKAPHIKGGKPLGKRVEILIVKDADIKQGLIMTHIKKIKKRKQVKLQRNNLKWVRTVQSQRENSSKRSSEGTMRFKLMRLRPN